MSACEMPTKPPDDLTATITVLRRNAFGDTPVAQIDHICLPLANFEGADLRHIAFDFSNLAGANFTGSKIGKDTFSRSTLTAAMFKGANLTGAEIVETDLHFIFFTSANLTKAEFINGSLFGAKFSEADLTSTCFAATDLMASSFALDPPQGPARNIDKARFFADKHISTEWPDGFNPPAIIDHVITPNEILHYC